jgi:epidermal growth factor receptor substrate 15
VTYIVLSDSRRDLADINNDGRLTRDGFAVAMHLIQGKLAGREVPVSLLQSLVPPSMRVNGTTSSSAPPPQEQVNLLWDDTPPPSASPVPAQTHNPVFSPPPISPPKPQTAVQDPFGSATFAISCESYAN